MNELGPAIVLTSEWVPHAGLTLCTALRSYQRLSKRSVTPAYSGYFYNFLWLGAMIWPSPCN